MAGNKIEEMRIQSSFHLWMNQNHPELRGLCYHIQNESNKKSHSYDVSIGIVSGIPDYHILQSNSEYKSIYIEFKAQDGKLSIAQIETHEKIRSAGHFVCTAYSKQEAIDYFLDYLYS